MSILQNDAGAALTRQLRAKSQKRRADTNRLAATATARPARRNDILPALTVVELPIETLRMEGRRLRKKDAAHVSSVANAIASLGFCQPILIGADNVVLDGDIRVEAARQLGLCSVPCIRIGHLNAVEQRILRLAVNRLGEKGEWNLDELKIEFEELIVLEATIAVTGFGAAEIDQILLGEDAVGLEQGGVEPTVGSVATARPGDVFCLGGHRLICGDATDPRVLARLMDGAPPARLILTDVPYNARIQGNVTGQDHREFAMASGEMSPEQFLTFNGAWMAACLPYVCDGGLFGTFIDWRGQPTVHAAATANGLEQINLITWVKTNAGMGSLWRSQHELLPMYKKGNAPHVNNVALGKNGRWRSNVWTHPGASSMGSDARTGLKLHPTVKPSAMLHDALLDITKRGDIVLDPFVGSGSMIIAAQSAGRLCRGVEIDPLYVDVIAGRFETVTGVPATLEASGEAFADVAARRRGEGDGGP